MKKNNIYLDYIRIILCVFIFLYHLNVLKGGYLAVCSFFVLSGFLSVKSICSREKINLFSYYKKRLFKIYLPFFIVTMLTFTIYKLTMNTSWITQKNETISVLLGYNNYWQISANMDYFARHISSPFMHFWYMGILLQFELAFPIVYALTEKIKNITNKHIIFIFYLLLSLLLSILFYYYSLKKNVMLTYYSTESRIFSLIFGVTLGYFYENYNHTRVHTNLLKKILFFCYLLISIVLFFLVSSDSKYYAISMIGVSLITLRMISLINDYNYSENNIYSNTFKFLSNQTYMIYLVQYPVIFFLTDISIKYKNIFIILITFIISIILNFALNISKTKKKKLLRLIFLLILLLISFYGLYLLITSKDYEKEMSNLEDKISENEKLMKEKQREYEENSKRNEEDFNTKIELYKTEEEKIRAQIINAKIVAIGDYIMLGAAQKLYDEFQNIYIDAKVSRTAWEANNILKELGTNDNLGDIVVFGLGSNGDCDNNCKKEIMLTCSDKQVYWINVTNDSSVKFNAKLEEFAKDYSNLYIIDWDSISKGHNEYFLSDGIHLTVAGEVAYTQAVFDKIYEVNTKNISDEQEQFIAEYENNKNQNAFYGNDLLINISSYLVDNEKISKSTYVTNTNLTFEEIKDDLNKDNFQASKIILVIDNTLTLSIDQINYLTSNFSDKEIYIFTTNKDNINNLKNIEKIKLYDLSEVINKNSDYLMIDKVHLTDSGNKYLINFIEEVIK